MLKFPKTIIALSAIAVSFVGTSLAYAGPHNIGREALPEEVQAWNTDVRPDGQGLPAGAGTVEQGEVLFSEQCAACHGDFGEGVDRWPVLAGGHDSLESENPVKTVGSYWPYLSTAFDYIKRAMPFGNAQSLSDDDVYALVAYILNMNELVEADFELNQKNFLDVRLPNEANFIEDQRPDTRLLENGEPCMKNCKTDVKITARARVIDVTPEDAERRKKILNQGVVGEDKKGLQ